MLKAEAGIEVVGEAADGYQTLSLTQTLRPDIVLADISMPGLSGIEVTQELKRILPETRVLILTMHEDGGLLQEAIRAGASGYLIKRAAEADLITAIHTVANGELYVHEDMRAAMPRELMPRPASSRNGDTQLSEEDVELLRLITRGYTNRRIADTLNKDLSVIEDAYAALIKRLGVRGRVGLIQYAKEHGIT